MYNPYEADKTLMNQNQELHYLMQTSANSIKSKVVKISELETRSLQISSFQRIPARNCVPAFLEHHQST